MQSTLIKHNKFFKAGHATSFDTAKKYAISCDASSSEFASIATPGFITTGDFSFTMSFRYNDGIGSWGAFQITGGLTCRMHSGNGTFRIVFSDGINFERMDTNNNLGDGEWHTIVITCDRDGDMDYYEDYDAIGSGYTESVDISSVTGSLEDAGSDDNWYFGHDGGTQYAGIDIDQIAFWDSSLSVLNSTLIYFALWNNSTSINDIALLPDPICYWKCNEGTGTTVANDGSESDAMTLYNTPTWITDGMI